MLKHLSIFLTIGIVLSTFSKATAFEIRVGDADGFGYGEGIGLQAASGRRVNVDEAGILGNGDFLPDLNRNGRVAFNQGDDFDNRTLLEIEKHFLTGTGFSDRGSTGSEFTDVSLSTSFRNTFPNPILHPFPGDNNPNTRTDNKPGFQFKFFVDSSDITSGVPLYFNLVFGDYDVYPAKVLFTKSDGSTFASALKLQPNTKNGLIQATFASLNFSDVFTTSATGFDGFLQVDFIAPNEPYTAFDYAEISTTPIQESVPEPRAIAGLLTAFLGLTLLRKK